MAANSMAATRLHHWRLLLFAEGPHASVDSECEIHSGGFMALAKSRSDGPSYRQSRFSITLQPVVAIFLPPTHAHLVVDHRCGVMSGGAQILIVLNRTPCLFLATQLRKGGRQDEVERGWPILIHAVDFDDLVVIAR